MIGSVRLRNMLSYSFYEFQERCLLLYKAFLLSFKFAAHPLLMHCINAITHSGSLITVIFCMTMPKLIYFKVSGICCDVLPIKMH